MWRFLKGIEPPPQKKQKTSEGKNAVGKLYDQTKRLRTFQQSWLKHPDFQSWLRYDSENNLMFCTICESSDVSTRGKSAGKKMRTLFVKGCPSMRIESLQIHAKCETHVRNTEIKKAKETPVGMSEADRCLRMLNQTALKRLKTLFHTSHSLAKHGRPFRDFTWQCALDKAKGLDLGVTYINEKQCKVFTDAISEVERGKLEKNVCDAPYFSIMCDEATDAAIVEQLILFIRFSVSGVPKTHFLAIQSLERATAENCYTEILRALYEQCGLKSEDVWNKLIGFGSDGASVMTGKRSGVAARLREHQPALQAVHCIAHRLELAIKDALKMIPAYEKLQQFLFNLYGFYHYSTLNRGLLRSTAEALSITRFIPTRTGGTRWIGHTKGALENFHSGMPAILQHMLEIKDDQQTSAASKGKVAGFIKLLSSKSFLDFSYFMRDVVNVLARLSKYFQIQELAIAEMPKLVKDTIASLKKLKTQHGPLTREFRRKIDQDPVFHEHTEQQLDGPLMPLTTFHSVLDKLTESISLRLNVDDPILDAAVRITNLKCWPVHKEDEFGDEEIVKLVDYFKPMIERNAESNMVESEWTSLKDSIYASFKPVHAATWHDVNSKFSEDVPNVLMLVDLLLTVPSSSVECERGFSLMKRIKSDWRNRLGSSTLTSLMRVQLETPGEDEFDPLPAIQYWNANAQRIRRPFQPRYGTRKPTEEEDITESEGEGSDFAEE